ncbi:MAG: hypothetical protein AB9M60_15925 [Leptothrix sp. (in: b-proteobacteria)]
MTIARHVKSGLKPIAREASTFGRSAVGLTAIGLAISGSAWAEPGSLYVGASEAVSHETNVLRARSGLPSANDWVSTTSLLAGAHPRLGQQQFGLDVVARASRYRDNGQLDHTGGDARLGLDWQAPNALSGRIGYSGHRGLTQFGTATVPVLTSKNLATSQEAVASVLLGVPGSPFELESALTLRRLDDSAPEFDFQDVRQHGLSVGGRYRPSAALTVGLGARHTLGNYPHATLVAPSTVSSDDFRRNDIDLTALWVPTGLSRLQARLSQTRETHDQVPTRNVSGLTALLHWDYQVTPKVKLATEAARDTGTETAFLRITSGADALASSGTGLSNSLSLAATYQASAKTQFVAHVRSVRRSLQSAVVGPGGVVSSPAGSDRSTEYGLGVSVEPARPWLIGCSVSREQRVASSSVSFPYRAGSAGCSVQYKTL